MIDFNYTIPAALLDELTPEELEKFRKAEKVMKNTQGFSMVAVRYFSDMALMLALRSFKMDRGFKIPIMMLEIFNKYVEPYTSNMDLPTRELVSETRLDFLYAGGNHRSSSLRMAMMFS